jgi:hypothetical protein
MHTLTGGQEAGIGAKAGRRGLLGLTRRPSPDAPPLLLLSRPPAAPRPLARLATSVAGPGLGVPAVARAVPRIAAAVPARRVAAGLERRRDRPPPVHRSIGANSLDCLATGDPRERLPLAGARAHPPPLRRPSPAAATPSSASRPPPSASSTSGPMAWRARRRRGPCSTRCGRRCAFVFHFCSYIVSGRLDRRARRIMVIDA